MASRCCWGIWNAVLQWVAAQSLVEQFAAVAAFLMTCLHPEFVGKSLPWVKITLTATSIHKGEFYSATCV